MAIRSEWDPMREMLQVQKRLNDLFETALARTDFETKEGFGSWTPVADVYETPVALHLDLEIPGLEQEEIDVRLDGDELVVEGERRMDREQEGEQFHRVERSYGKFSRRFRLPSTVDRATVDAVYRHGLLRVTLPRKERQHPETVRVSVR
jgi:HSP20 family protein